MTPDSIAALLINLQVGEALILPSETKLKYVESAIETARAHTTLKRYVLGQHMCPQAGMQFHRVVCCSAATTTTRRPIRAANRSLMKRRRPQLRATRLEPRQ